MKMSPLKRLLVGAPIPTAQAHHERLSKRSALAVFASDALSSVAYATEESASDEKTARAEVRERRSCRACAVASGDPTNSFLTALIFTRAASRSR